MEADYDEIIEPTKNTPILTKDDDDIHKAAKRLVDLKRDREPINTDNLSNPSDIESMEAPDEGFNVSDAFEPISVDSTLQIDSLPLFNEEATETSNTSFETSLTNSLSLFAEPINPDNFEEYDKEVQEINRLLPFKEPINTFNSEENDECDKEVEKINRPFFESKNKVTLVPRLREINTSFSPLSEQESSVLYDEFTKVSALYQDDSTPPHGSLSEDFAGFKTPPHDSLSQGFAGFKTPPHDSSSPAAGYQTPIAQDQNQTNTPPEIKRRRTFSPFKLNQCGDLPKNETSDTYRLDMFITPTSNEDSIFSTEAFNNNNKRSSLVPRKKNNRVKKISKKIIKKVMKYLVSCYSFQDKMTLFQTFNEWICKQNLEFKLSDIFVNNLIVKFVNSCII
jgi:hypothetical protein